MSTQPSHDLPPQTPTRRIAMWSGPRNISTAMLRAFAMRPDCEVVDEPLYAAYLSSTGLDHPGRAEILAAQPTDWRAVVTGLEQPGEMPVRYVKHMAHHLTDDIGRAWLDGWTHAFLIRDPAAMLRSLDKVLPFTPRLIDTGLPQQVELFERLGGPVVAAEDVLADPAGALSGLCGALGLDWTPAMLTWPEGPHPADGVWAHHWYGAVWASTGFGPPRPAVEGVPDHLTGVLAEAAPLHARLAAHRTAPTEA